MKAITENKENQSKKDNLAMIKIISAVGAVLLISGIGIYYYKKSLAHGHTK